MKLNYFYINIFCFVFFSRVTFCHKPNYLKNIYSFFEKKETIMLTTIPLIIGGQIFCNHIKNNKINDIEGQIELNQKKLGLSAKKNIDGLNSIRSKIIDKLQTTFEFEANGMRFLAFENKNIINQNKNLDIDNNEKVIQQTNSEIIKNFLLIITEDAVENFFYHIYIKFNNTFPVYKKTFKIDLNKNSNQFLNCNEFLDALANELAKHKELEECIEKFKKQSSDYEKNIKGDNNQINKEQKKLNQWKFRLSVIKFFLLVFQTINFLHFCNSRNKNIKNSSIYTLPILSQILSIPYFYRPLILLPYMRFKLKLLGEE